MLRVDESRNETKVELTVGQTLELLLPENPTAGFRWHMISAGGTAIKPIKDEYVRPDGKKGSAGSHRWLFRAAEPGEATIELVYRRPWEQTAGKRFSLQIVVMP